MGNSTAISAQGSTLEISTGSGSGITITAISKANPCVLTLASAVPVGTRLTLSSIVGMTELNGQQVTVQYVDGLKVALANVNSTAYTAYTSGGTATPVAKSAIGNLKTFGGFDGDASEMDTSHLGSSGKEYLLGLKDEGTLQVDVDYDATDPGQAACETARTTAAAKTFTLTFPNGRGATFTAFVKKFSKNGGVDQVLKSQIALRITGAVSWF